MNEQKKRMEKQKNNRCRLLHKVYALKQEAPFFNISFKTRVQNMIKQIQSFQNERRRCKSEFENQFPQILRLNPVSKPQNVAPTNLRLNTIRTTSRQSNFIIDGANQKGKQPKQASLDQNRRFSSDPLRFNSKIKTQIQTFILKDTIPIKDRQMKIEKQTQLEYNLFENISSWSRKTSESIL
ncbi:unnamed protein product [Paramecium sonneborni]|uniref:Uncharacterized protein n=1 Tax=Paramecium sonneborni TaxID=65129 RepID=A0A8S1K6J1_9CILI|nr:unnamed protein product [Paramecium sonneborni]CAD8050998.1 unnamed protein product [Paramecium sonneborni]